MSVLYSMSIHLHLCKSWHDRKEADGGRETVARRRKGEQTVSEKDEYVGCLDIPLFSMAWIRLTRTGGAVSGGVNCSLRSGTETAETTTQITATLLAQSLTKTSSTDKGTVNYEQLEITEHNIISRTKFCGECYET